MSSSTPPTPTPAEDNDVVYASQLLNSVVLPMVLNAAVEMDLFEIMRRSDQGGGLTAHDIAAKLNTSNAEAPAMLDRLLCLLATHDILKCSSASGGGAGRVYSLAPVCNYFVRNETGVSFAPLLNLLQDKVFIESWFHLKDAVLEGGVPFDRAHGVHAFEYPGQDERFNRLFNQAMHNHTTIFMSNMLEGYKGFEELTQVVDVGGGFGVSASMIASKYPHIKAINFDLPHVIQNAPSYPGVEHVGGDMFESVPSGDAIFMKWILHDWSDAHCLKLLKNCYKALPDNGKVIVVDANLPDLPDTSSATKSISQMDVLMLAQNPGGKERRAHEFLALAKEAGFSGITHAGCFCLFWVMEFYK
uniref:Uncharacterized protein n=1 Tax=Kalanchoe fedtschenkoi TaxID=63787 RepID=A0A7N1A8L4_KALFE